MAEVTLGGAVKSRRKELGMSRPSLAQLAGTSTSTIMRLECRDQLPRFQTIVAVTRALRLSLDELAANL